MDNEVKGNPRMIEALKNELELIGLENFGLTQV